MQSKRQGWDSDEIAEEASQKDEDEIQREMKRGDETEGNANERDDAGSVDKNETPHGREEKKHNIKEQSK